MSKPKPFFVNDVFQDEIGRFWAVLGIHQPFAYLNELKKPGAWPIEVLYREVLDGAYGTPVKYSHPGLNIPDPSEKGWADAKAKFELLRPLLKHTPRIFDANERKRLIIAHAKEIKHSPTTLYKYLWTYWTGGQSLYALLHANYLRPGRTNGGETAGRGHPSRRGVPIYQMRGVDKEKILKWLKKDYLNPKRKALRAVFERYLYNFCRVADGNGDLFASPEGQRPSFHQFRSVLEANYTGAERKAKRKKRQTFASEDKETTGSVDQDAVGVGHTYEIDATTLDLWLVSRKNRRFIIGKATLYLIIDRVSRLIVGFYLCLYKPCWAGAVQAILSIAEDKEEMCRRYGVKYDPEDWPAHCVFPDRFFGDKGEMFSKNSDRIPHLEIDIANPESWKPQAKPVVESRFHLIQERDLAPSVPGYQPPMQATIRGGKLYYEDARLNIEQATAAILGLVIRQNKSVIKEGRVTEAMVEGVRPVPRELWNHGIRTSSGLGRRFDYDHVWRHLMPTSTATPTPEGLSFNKLLYTCPMAVQRGWFQKTSTAGSVVVTYNTRLVNTIWIHFEGKLYPATLVEPLKFFLDYSFPEVAAIMMKVRDMIADHDANESLDAQFEWEDLLARIITPLKVAADAGKLKRPKSKESQAARAHENREHTRETEDRRQTQSKHTAGDAAPHAKSSANVVPLRVVSPAPSDEHMGDTASTRPTDALDEALANVPTDWI